MYDKIRKKQEERQIFQYFFTLTASSFGESLRFRALTKKQIDNRQIFGKGHPVGEDLIIGCGTERRVGSTPSGFRGERVPEIGSLRNRLPIGIGIDDRNIQMKQPQGQLQQIRFHSARSSYSVAYIDSKAPHNGRKRELCHRPKQLSANVGVAIFSSCRSAPLWFGSSAPTDAARARSTNRLHWG